MSVRITSDTTQGPCFVEGLQGRLSFYSPAVNGVAGSILLACKPPVVREGSLTAPCMGLPREAIACTQRCVGRGAQGAMGNG